MCVCVLYAYTRFKRPGMYVEQSRDMAHVICRLAMCIDVATDYNSDDLWNQRVEEHVCKQSLDRCTAGDTARTCSKLKPLQGCARMVLCRSTAPLSNDCRSTDTPIKLCCRGYSSHTCIHLSDQLCMCSRVTARIHLNMLNHCRAALAWTLIVLLLDQPDHVDLMLKAMVGGNGSTYARITLASRSRINITNKTRYEIRKHITLIRNTIVSIEDSTQSPAACGNNSYYT
jgi:hypothetical protein